MYSFDVFYISVRHFLTISAMERKNLDDCFLKRVDVTLDLQMYFFKNTRAKQLLLRDLL